MYISQVVWLFFLLILDINIHDICYERDLVEACSFPKCWHNLIIAQKIEKIYR